MQCAKCGAELPEGAESCPACGERAADSRSGEATQRGFATARRPVVYAGFWIRAAAYLLDSVLLAAALTPFLLPIVRNNHADSSLQQMLQFYGSWTRQSIAFTLLIHLTEWLYSATMESSAWQATVGKRIFGLRVADAEGRRLTFLRATARHFGKYLSSFLFLGFILVGFTEKRQGLHDLIAGTFVLKRV
ncbi:MAG TPA: RDD family protein [Verrucomicrobiae bacterium]|nr:RDD family protein [Verrucomicrobiae bacterium]